MESLYKSKERIHVRAKKKPKKTKNTEITCNHQGSWEMGMVNTGMNKNW